MEAAAPMKMRRRRTTTMISLWRSSCIPTKVIQYYFATKIIAIRESDVLSESDDEAEEVEKN